MNERESGARAEVVQVAMAVLVRGERVLLVHRHPARAFYPDVWDTPGGHLEPGETASACVVRECREELGVELERFWLGTPVHLPGVVTHLFECDAWEGEPVNAAPDEHDDMGWFTADEVDGLTVAIPEVPAIVRAAIASAAR